MKNIIVLKKILTSAVPIGLLLIVLFFTACDEDDTMNGTINITGVYLQDVNSTVQDRPVNFARLGQLLRLQGSGFTGLSKIYINGFETFFNTVYVSDSSLLVRISGDTPTVDADEVARNTIRLVRGGQETIYSFEIRDSAPTITNISNTLPNEGEEITVFGTGLLEVSKVIFPGNIEVTTGITFDAVDGEFFTVTVPSGIPDSGGPLLAETANGRVYSPSYFNVRNGLILNFDGTGALGEFGNTIRQDELKSATVGEGNISQGNYVYHGPADGETFGAGANRNSEVFTSGSESWRSAYTSFIPVTTPVDSVAFQFEVYVPEPWEGTGFIQILLINNFNGGEFSGGVYNYIPWIVEGEVEPFQTTGWTTVTVPFSEFYLFSDGEFTFEDVLQYREGATFKNFGFFFNNSDIALSNVIDSNSDEVFAASETSIAVYTDNWRIVSLEVPALSDFPE